MSFDTIGECRIEIQRLKGKLESALEMIGANINSIQNLQESLAEKEKELEKEHENFLSVHRENMKAGLRIMELHGALEKYGKHTFFCESTMTKSDKCDCGLDQAVKGLA